MNQNTNAGSFALAPIVRDGAPESAARLTNSQVRFLKSKGFNVSAHMKIVICQSGPAKGWPWVYGERRNGGKLRTVKRNLNAILPGQTDAVKVAKALAAAHAEWLGTAANCKGA